MWAINHYKWAVQSKDAKETAKAKRYVVMAMNDTKDSDIGSDEYRFRSWWYIHQDSLHNRLWCLIERASRYSQVFLENDDHPGLNYSYEHLHRLILYRDILRMMCDALDKLEMSNYTKLINDMWNSCIPLRF